MNLSSLLAGDVGDIMKEELLPENVPLFGNLFGEHLMVNPSFRTAFSLPFWYSYSDSFSDLSSSRDSKRFPERFRL